MVALSISRRRFITDITAGGAVTVGTLVQSDAQAQPAATTKRTGFFMDEYCFWHTTGEHALTIPVGGWVQPPDGEGHPESPASKRRLKSLMDVSGLTKSLEVRTASPASEETIRRVHTADYIKLFKEQSDIGGGELGFSAPFGRNSFEIATLSAGLAIAAVNSVLAGEFENAYALSRPPGHHCLPGSGMGFCLLSNISIAIESAKAAHGVERVAVLDWDVHHGNGTQTIFYERPDVLTISIHQERCFPLDGGAFEERGAGKGKGTNLNIPLQPGGGQEAYLSALEKLAFPTIRQFQPDLLIIACGFDANGVDPLARMLLSSLSFREMTKRAKMLAGEVCEGRLVLVHEGGYSETYVPFCGLATIEELAGIGTAVEDPFLPIISAQQPGQAFNRFQGRLIDEMAEALAAGR